MLENIKEILRKHISSTEKLGPQVGGSGHHGSVSLSINEIKPPVEETIDEKKAYRVMFSYTLTVVTEFTIYPDNPPHEDTYEKTIWVDRAGNVVKSTDKKCIKSNWDPFEFLHEDL
ncbi:MAG: hypothetical protein E3J87_05890 [Candidatus Cloacimonadota bacterium]|nr:MAG: hypothetical protein E3J87_05890 [Candidatus Cloacimonadota bacterium]